MTITNYFHICGKMLTFKGSYYICRNVHTGVRQLANESILRSIACLVDNSFVLVLADRSVFHPSVMLSDNRVSLAPTPKQMDIENVTLFPPPRVNFPFTKSDCQVKRIYFSVCWKYLEILCVDHTRWKVKCDNILPIYFSGGKVYKWKTGWKS